MIYQLKKISLLIAITATAVLSACTGVSPTYTATAGQAALSPTESDQAMGYSTPTKPDQAVAYSTPTHAPGCTVQSRLATPNPTVESLIPAVTDEDWTKGPEDAVVTILEYSDFQ